MKFLVSTIYYKSTFRRYQTHYMNRVYNNLWDQFKLIRLIITVRQSFSSRIDSHVKFHASWCSNQLYFFSELYNHEAMCCIPNKGSITGVRPAQVPWFNGGCVATIAEVNCSQAPIHTIGSPCCLECTFLTFIPGVVMLIDYMT